MLQDSCVSLAIFYFRLPENKVGISCSYFSLYSLEDPCLTKSARCKRWLEPGELSSRLFRFTTCVFTGAITLGELICFVKVSSFSVRSYSYRQCTISEYTSEDQKDLSNLPSYRVINCYTVMFSLWRSNLTEIQPSTLQLRHELLCGDVFTIKDKI